MFVLLGWWLLGAGAEPVGPSGSDNAGSAHDTSTDHQRPRTPSLDLNGAAKAAITGTIRDTAGQPIAGAHVCGMADTHAVADGPHQLPCARSGADGRYRIDGLFPVWTGVSASAPSFKPGRWAKRVEVGVYQLLVLPRAGQTTTDIDITLEAGGVLMRGVVKDIVGGEIEGAQVSSHGMLFTRHGVAVGLSDEQGQFEMWVAPGELYVNAFADGYAEAAVEVVAPGEFVELFMTPESVLVGKVVLASSGEAVEGVTVDAGFARGTPRTAQTDAEGQFRIDQLQPGTYKPSARADQLFGEFGEQVHLGLGQTSAPIVIRVHPAARVDGDVILAGSGQPCHVGSVRLAGDAGELLEGVDHAGHVSFRGVLPGEYAVSVRCIGAIADEDYPKITVAAENLNQVWEVREGLAIRGRIVDEAGEPIDQIRIMAVPIVDGDDVRAQVTRGHGTSEADGSFELAGLLAGAYELQNGTFRGRPGPSEPTDVHLESGADTNDVVIVMPSVGTIRGRIVDESGSPVSGATLLAEQTGGQAKARSNDAGEFEISNLRPGSTRVTAREADNWIASAGMRKPGTGDDDVQGELVEVIANEVVELALTVESRDGRITGVVTDEEGGAVADAFIAVNRTSEQAGANAAMARAMVRWSGDSQPVLTDQDGRFEFEGLPDGQYIVLANRKGGGDAIAEGVALGSHVELVITNTGEIAGTVALADGTVPQRFSLTIRDKAAGIYLRDSYFRTGGVWRVTEVPAGTFEIVASAVEGNTTLEPPLVLTTGEARAGVELILASRVTLRGRLIDLETREPIAGLQVQVSGVRSDGAQHLNVSDADGRFEIADAPAGRVRVQTWSRAGDTKSKYGDQWHSMSLAPTPQVQDIGELELVARRIEPNEHSGDLGYELNPRDPTVEPEAFEVVVASVRPGGPADLGGLHVGDVIDQIGGLDVVGVHAGRYANLTTVPEGTVLNLGVRGRENVVIVVGPPLN